MTNLEKHLDAILQIASDLAVHNDNPTRCALIECCDCDLGGINECDENLLEWLFKDVEVE